MHIIPFPDQNKEISSEERFKEFLERIHEVIESSEAMAFVSLGKDGRGTIVGWAGDDFQALLMGENLKEAALSFLNNKSGE